MQKDWYTCWNNDRTIQFLELVERESAIWDPSDKYHKNKHKVQEAWKRISRNMDNAPVEELKAKKKSLMATFRPLLKKKKNSIKIGTSESEVFQPIWFAYNVMERFLGSTYDVEDEAPGNDDTSSPVQKTPTKPPTTVTKNNLAYFKKRPRLLTTDFLIDKTEKKINDSLDTLNRVLEEKRIEEDDCEIYGKLLARKLRKYPERMRDKIMHKIDGLLLDNPYPEERPSSGSPSQSPLHYQNSTSNSVYVIPHFPVEVKMAEGNDT